MEDWILLLGGLILLLATLFTLLVYSGVFATVEVKTGKPVVFGCVRIAYKDGTGSYQNVGSTFTESTSIAPNLKQLGLYYDDPAKVPAEKLRWAVGAILSENDEPVDEEIRAAYEKRNYKFMTLPAVPLCVRSQFPYATMISIFVAVKRVYPRLMHYIQERGLEAYPFLEIYIEDVIHFMAPLSSQMEFYTPKAMESEPEQAREVVEEVTDLIEPVDDSVSPVKPVDDPVKPADDPVKPADDPVKPADDPVKPADDPVKPADDPVKPVDDPVKPADDPVKPADDLVKPVDDPVKPADDPVKPADDPVKPADDPVKPADDPVKPADDPVKPADDPVKPADDPVKPANDPVKPAGDPVETVSSAAATTVASQEVSDPVEKIVDAEVPAASGDVLKQGSSESDSDGSFEKIDADS